MGVREKGRNQAQKLIISCSQRFCIPKCANCRGVLINHVGGLSSGEGEVNWNDSPLPLNIFPLLCPLLFKIWHGTTPPPPGSAPGQLNVLPSMYNIFIFKIDSYPHEKVWIRIWIQDLILRIRFIRSKECAMVFSRYFFFLSGPAFTPFPLPRILMVGPLRKEPFYSFPKKI